MEKRNTNTNSNTNSGANVRRNTGKRPASFDRPKPEFDQKIVDIRRVTRVVAGGRRFSFSVVLAAGDRKGAVGLGLGKAGDTSLAINKALRNAKKNMIKVNLTKSSSLPHEVSSKYSSSKIVIIPNKGRGLVAGSVLRDIIKLAGIKDVTGKILSGTKNKLNNSKAVMAALSQVSTKYIRPVESQSTEKPFTKAEKPFVKREFKK